MEEMSAMPEGRSERGDIMFALERAETMEDLYQEMDTILNRRSMIGLGGESDSVPDPYADAGALPTESTLLGEWRKDSKGREFFIEPPPQEEFGRSLMEDEIPRQRERNRRMAEKLDNWQHRAKGMRCSTCMWYVPKQGSGSEGEKIGRCRRHAPTMNGWPAMFPTDFCGDHKLDETKI